MLGDDSYLRFFCIRIFELAPPPLVFDSPPSLLKTYNESSANVVLGTIFRADRVARYDGALLPERRGRTRLQSVDIISLVIPSHSSHSCLRHHHFFTLFRRRAFVDARDGPAYLGFSATSGLYRGFRCRIDLRWPPIGLDAAA